MATHSSVLAWRIPGTEEPGATVRGVTQSWARLKRLSTRSRRKVVYWKVPSLKTPILHYHQADDSVGLPRTHSL